MAMAFGGDCAVGRGVGERAGRASPWPGVYRPGTRLAVRGPGGLEVVEGDVGTATAGAGLGEWLRHRWIDFGRVLGHRRCHSEEFARSHDGLGAVRAGEQAVVADAMEAFGQHVDEEPANEF